MLKKTNNFSIECLGEQEYDVYDLEVDEHHNFFANDILVHNSNYYDFSKLVKLECLDKGITDKQQITDMIDSFSKEVIQPILDSITEKLSKEVLNSDENIIKLVRDTIADESILLRKKHYIMSVLDTEGTRHPEPKMKIMGIRAIKSNIPKICRDKLKKIIPVILHETNDRLIEEIKKFRSLFNDTDVELIALNSGMKDYRKYVDQNGLPKKGCPYHVRAAANYNNALKQFNLLNEYQPLRSGEKIKIVYLKNINPFNCKSIAFPTPVPKKLDIDKHISYSEQFEKAFLMPLSKIIEPIGWKAEKKKSLF